ncbi:hypothetical protein FPQ18DRAFT_404557 [Pyronema domesticum]|uniref:Similar to Uncharacterized protein C56F8.12 acc. no. Q10260 n=1 Tax=Pyronema omphalodes (strain CBS 100304) TaxID=1076935 RepID=U4LAI0_PYROM|nr:hypothetical protein FPQ18DRAFT_404557 [Pyronema domesticum]CCX15942.1 Similar to Uncharacterized protein C56F8.12; acc. no. Q10260 [Pyronema omphalodes CBS 100304]
MASPYNETHVQFDGHYFNETLLKEFNYTIYGNGTLSNDTNCFLVFDVFNVFFLPNGTSINGTSCSIPIHNIATRGGLGIAFGAIFAILIILATTCLAKHGAVHLPLSKSFRPVSRRWPWYWLLVAGTCGCISGMVAIDIDRDYLQGTALILQNIFYYVLLPATLASVWEMTRHWGSLCERILLDEDPWRFPHEGPRDKAEFYLPLVFYLFGFMTFFLSVLRTWTMVSKGTWSPDVSAAIAASTDGRFKASSIMAFIAWCVIWGSVFTSVKYYQPVSRHVPWKIPISMTFLLIRIIYNIGVAWEYDIGPLRPTAPVAYIYALGYAPIALAMLTMVIWGRMEPNDDIRIKDLRRERERATDFELGINQGKKEPKEQQLGLPPIQSYSRQPTEEATMKNNPHSAAPPYVP